MSNAEIKELETVVDQIPHSANEWWKSENRETFIKAAASLREHGYSFNEIEEMLSRLYWAVASEYGD